MIRQEKQTLRMQMKAALMAFSGKTAASARIRDFLQGSELWKTAEVIYGYSPLPSEPDWRGGAWPPEKTLAFPQVTAAGLVFVTGRDFRLGAHGVHEPADALPASPAGLVLVPGLAFDARGYRLGRGGGYYDRFLETLGQPRPVLCGVCFACQIVPEIPREAHDARVDFVVSENGLLSACG
jgi:5-formyltetrahydrofolate cyclo-ligase